MTLSLEVPYNSKMLIAYEKTNSDMLSATFWFQSIETLELISWQQ